MFCSTYLLCERGMTVVWSNYRRTTVSYCCIKQFINSYCCKSSGVVYPISNIKPSDGDFLNIFNAKVCHRVPFEMTSNEMNVLNPKLFCPHIVFIFQGNSENCGYHLVPY